MQKHSTKTTDYEIIMFKNQSIFRLWLEKNHKSVNGIWMRLYKKASGVESITYAEALDEALCYGWIDGQKKSYDEKSYLQKFTPRRARSIWSKRNIEHVGRLTKNGLIMPSGLAEIQGAQGDGRWQQAYDTPTNMKVPDYFVEELKKHPKAQEFFNTLNKTNTYAIAWRLQTAKTTETKDRRMEKIISLLNAGQKLH